MWNELHAMPPTIDTHFKPDAEPSNFDATWLRRTGWRYVCVHVVFLMVCYLCRCVISCVVSCFDGGRSCRHVVNLKGRRGKDAQP